MNISCDVIRDLLPLYYDDVCSKDSCELIEGHIDNCKACKDELDKYRIEINGINNMKEARPLKEISKRWKKDKKGAFLKGMTVVSIIGSILSIVLYNAKGSYVDENGYLVESFAYIPLAYLFAFIALVSVGTLGISALITRSKVKRMS